MALSPALEDREQGKFRDAGDSTVSRVAVVSEGSFTVPAEADAFTVELANANMDVVYKFRSGGVSGTVLSTITLTYATAQTLDLVSGVLT